MKPLQYKALALTILGFTIAAPTLSQSHAPLPDRQGNYFSNDAPIKGTALSPSTKGSLWQITTPQLNCHSRPTTDSPVVRQFNLSQVIQAEVGRGGADEVLRNVKDKNGNPWMPTRSMSGENYNCYVRANRHYIQPYSSKQQNLPLI